MNPKIWGRSFWTMMFCIAWTYPIRPTTEHQRHVRDWFTTCQYMLPCADCRQHYRENILKYPIQLTSRPQLIQWVLLIHNQVNQRLGQPTLSLEEALQKYITPKQMPKTEPRFGWRSFIRGSVIGLAVGVTVGLVLSFRWWT